MSSYINYQNTTRYWINIAPVGHPGYPDKDLEVDILDTQEISVFLESPEGGDRLHECQWSTNLLPLVFMAVLIPTGITIAWIIKKKHSPKHE